MKNNQESAYEENLLAEILEIAEKPSQEIRKAHEKFQKDIDDEIQEANDHISILKQS